MTTATQDEVSLPQASLGGGLSSFTQSRKRLAIAGGAVVLLVVVLVFALGGNKNAAKTAPASAKTKPTSREPAVADKPVTPTEPVAAVEPTVEPPTEPTTGSAVAAADGSAATDTAAAPTGTATTATGKTDNTRTTGTTGTTATTAVATTGPTTAKKTGRTLGGKQVIVEYDTQAREAKPLPNIVAKDDQKAISKARVSYAAGNQRLFAGDAEGAIRYYRQALGYYPAYVAGYRGLGLAYERAGDKPKALQALRTYIGSAPTAKDAPLIRKRISTLSGH